MVLNTRVLWPLLVAAAVGVAACDNAETRAEKHYERGIELAEAGDVSRAMIEFRNVFALNPNHVPTLMAAGRLNWDQGDFARAYEFTSKATDLDPENVNFRADSAELAVRAGLWEDAERHIERLASDDEGVDRQVVLSEMLSYRAAVLAENETARNESADRMAQLSGPLPDLRLQTRFDDAVRDGDLGAALDLAEQLTESYPDASRYYELRLSVLNELQDQDGARELLAEMVSRFPDREDYATGLLQFLIQTDRADEAEAFLRSRINEVPEPDGQREVLVALINQIRGNEEAIAELDRMIGVADEPLRFRALRTALVYDAGRREEAIAELEVVAQEAEANNDERRFDYKLAIAKMLSEVGNVVEARQRVEEILSEDPAHVGAVKMKAAWLIQEDKADEAIVALRGALDQSPRDAEIMSLLADAHLRNGSRGLAGEMLNLAAEVSDRAPEPSLRYAQFLLADDNASAAETVIIEALRARPGDPSLLQALGAIYLRLEDWPRAEQVEATLRRTETDDGNRIADALRLSRLSAQDRGDEALSYLEELAQDDDTAVAAKIAIARSYLAARDFETAEQFLVENVEEAPDVAAYALLLASVYYNTERPEEGEETLRGLLATNDQTEGVWRALYQAKLFTGDRAGALAVLDEALGAMPDAPNLLWARAGSLEADGDIEGAIAVYEGLYERLPNSDVIANNLASMITTYRDGPEDLERAALVARRLANSTVPAFQDTYGWIAFRQGRYDEALPILEAAAAGLTADPIVQYHYGRALEQAGRVEEALSRYQDAIDIAGPGDTRAPIEDASVRLAALKSAQDGSTPSADAAPDAAPDGGSADTPGDN